MQFSTELAAVALAPSPWISKLVILRGFSGFWVLFDAVVDAFSGSRGSFYLEAFQDFAQENVAPPEKNSELPSFTPFYLILFSRLVWQQKSKVKGSSANPYSSIDERKAGLNLAKRPGAPIKLYTNHFDITVSSSSVVHRYYVDVSSPDWKGPPRRSDNPLISRAFEGKSGASFL